MNPADEDNPAPNQALNSIKSLNSGEHDFLSVIPSFRILATHPYRTMTNAQLIAELGLRKSSDTISLWKIAGQVMVDLNPGDRCSEVDIWNAVMEGWGTKGYRSTGLNAALQEVTCNRGSWKDFVQTVRSQTTEMRNEQDVGQVELLIRRLEVLSNRGILTEAEKSRLRRIASS